MKNQPQQPALGHIGPDGGARMVDVSAKAETDRFASAEAVVRVSPELARRIREDSLDKGDLLGTVRLAGIQAAKRTPDLIPLCHPVPLEHVDVRAVLEGDTVRITAEARSHSRTGVEMEALTAAAVAALTVIDMGKGVDRSMVIERIRVLEKRGGRSGHYVAPDSCGP